MGNGIVKFCQGRALAGFINMQLEKVLTAQKGIKGGQIFGTADFLLAAVLATIADRHGQCGCNRRGYFRLDGKNIGNWPFETVSPLAQAAL